MSQLIFLIMAVINPLISISTITLHLIVKIRCRKKTGCENDCCPFRNTCNKTGLSNRERALIKATLARMEASEATENKKKSL